MGIKSTLHFNNGDHDAQSPNASGEVKEGQKKAKEIATVARNALNNNPLFHAQFDRTHVRFCKIVAARNNGQF